MPADPSTINAALKETWTENRVAEQLYQGNPTLARIKRLNNTQTGDYAVTAIHTGRNWGLSATGPTGGTLNTAGNQSYGQATWNYTHQHAQVKIQGSAIDQTSGDALAVARVIDEEVTGALNDLNRQLTRQVFSDGNGYISGVQTGNSTTITLNAIDGVNALERGWVDAGASIDVGTLANPVAVLNGVAITSVSASTPSITTGSSANVTAGTHFVSLKGFRNASAVTGNNPSGTLEMNGLGNIVSTSAALGGVAAGSVWAASDVNTTSQAVQLPLLYTENQKVAQKTGKPATYIVTGLKQQRNVYQLAQAQVRFNGDNPLNVGNVNAVNVNGLSIEAVPDCKNEDIWFLTVEDLLLLTNGDPYWQDKITGGSRLEWVQGEDAYAGKITTRIQIGARRRNSHAALRGLT